MIMVKWSIHGLGEPRFVFAKTIVFKASTCTKSMKNTLYVDVYNNGSTHNCFQCDTFPHVALNIIFHFDNYVDLELGIANLFYMVEEGKYYWTFMKNDDPFNRYNTHVPTKFCFRI